MNYRWILVVAATMLIGSGSGLAQRRGMPPGPGMRGEGRLGQFKTMRLIEMLKLSEEDAVRFSVKSNAHEEKVRDMVKARNSLLDDIEKLSREKKEGHDFQATTDKVLDMDQQIFAERVRYQGEMRKFLTPEQFARFLVYERNFGRRVRSAMEQMHRERGGTDGDMDEDGDKDKIED
jgi:Spy/CpxP family protein refolding chaperone